MAHITMQFVPVDTIICFRASCPLVIAIIEYFYLDRELPSARSWLSLLGTVLCCVQHQICWESFVCSAAKILAINLVIWSSSSDALEDGKM